MVRKIQNYHRALTDYINQTIGLPFEWGVRDCILYAIGAIEAMMGCEGIKPEFTYRTRQEALAFAKNWSLIDGMKHQIQAYEVRHHFHQPGDIAIVNQGGFECAHVVFDRRAYAPLLGGFVTTFDMHKLYQQCPDVKILRFD